jgi:hypothetical protein
MTGTSDGARRAREIEEAVRPASERYRARRTGIDAVESKANVWFGGEGEQVADEALSAALTDETAREILAEAMRMGPRDRRLLLGIARQIASPGGDG